jgi:prepilin-type N-terminal cleavage/methylation domain-containing protein
MKMEKVDKRGFSLLELMMVVVIIAIMAAVALPNMSGWFSKKDLDSDARSLFSTLQQGRLQAIKGNEEVRISLNTGPNPDTYMMRSTSTGLTVGPTELSTGMSFEAPNFAGIYGVTTTGFNSRGLALQPGTITIVSSDAPSGHNKREITITIGGNVSITSP